jgi:hypothetical protein
MTLKRLVPLSGIVAVILVVIGFLVTGDTPDTDASTQEVASFYRSHDSDMLASGVLLALGGLFFLIFFATLRNFLRTFEAANAGASTFSFAGGILLTVGLAIFAGINFTLGDVPDKMDPSGLQTLNVMTENFFPPFAIGVLVFLTSTGVATVRTGAFPALLGWAIIVGAIFAVSPLFPIAMLALGVFTLVASVRMAMLAEERRPTSNP